MCNFIAAQYTGRCVNNSMNMHIFYLFKFHRTRRNSIRLKKHKSIWTVPYTVLVGNIGWHNQTSEVQLQKYPTTVFIVVFVYPQFVLNVATLSHFFKMCYTMKKRYNRTINMHMSSLVIYEGQVSDGVYDKCPASLHVQHDLERNWKKLIWLSMNFGLFFQT